MGTRYSLPSIVNGNDDDFVLVWKSQESRKKLSCALNPKGDIMLFSSDEDKTLLLYLKDVKIALKPDQLDETISEVNAKIGIVTTLKSLKEVTGWQ